MNNQHEPQETAQTKEQKDRFLNEQKQFNASSDDKAETLHKVEELEILDI